MRPGNALPRPLKNLKSSSRKKIGANSLHATGVACKEFYTRTRSIVVMTLAVIMRGAVNMGEAVIMGGGHHFEWISSYLLARILPTICASGAITSKISVAVSNGRFTISVKGLSCGGASKTRK